MLCVLGLLISFAGLVHDVSACLVRGAAVTGLIPKELARLYRLKKLHLQNNELSGESLVPRRRSHMAVQSALRKRPVDDAVAT